MISVRDLAGRTEESFQWWLHNRDLPEDIEKRILVQQRAINDLYALFAHFLEKLADLEGLPPGALGRKLYLPTGMNFHGSLQKFG